MNLNLPKELPNVSNDNGATRDYYNYINYTSSKEIFLDKDAVENSIADLQANLEELKTIKDTFDKTSKDMKEEWDGEGATAYETSCNTIHEQIEDSIKNLEDEINVLIKFKDAASTVDESGAQTMTKSGR